MAAGLGFKTFLTGDVLTAADTNGYLMQGINVFANAAARDAAITSPQEGQFCYLKDTNVSMFYTGAAWSNLDTTGMTNPMTTTADMIYSSSGSTPARLAIGTVGQVLAVNSGATAPEWTTATGGGLTFIKAQTIGTTVSTITVTSAFSSTYDNYLITISGGVADQDNFANLTLGATATGYYRYTVGGKYDSATVYGAAAQNATAIAETIYGSTSGVAGAFELFAPNLAKRTTFFTKTAANSTARYAITNNGYLDNATQYTAFTLTVNSGSFTGGTIRVYGYQNS